MPNRQLHSGFIYYLLLLFIIILNDQDIAYVVIINHKIIASLLVCCYLRIEVSERKIQFHSFVAAFRVMDVVYLNGAGSSSGNSDATSNLAVGEQTDGDTDGIYSMMNQAIDESSVMELEELFNSVVKNLPEDDFSSTKNVVNGRAEKTKVKKKKRKLPAIASNASTETNQKKKKDI